MAKTGRCKKIDRAIWRNAKAGEIQISMHRTMKKKITHQEAGRKTVQGRSSAAEQASLSLSSAKLVGKRHFTLQWSPRLVGWGWAIVGCMRSGVSSIHGCVAGLAIARMGLTILRGHWSVLVYAHPQFIPKSGWKYDTQLNKKLLAWNQFWSVHPAHCSLFYRENTDDIMSNSKNLEKMAISTLHFKKEFCNLT